MQSHRLPMAILSVLFWYGIAAGAPPLRCDVLQRNPLGVRGSFVTCRQPEPGARCTIYVCPACILTDPPCDEACAGVDVAGGRRRRLRLDLVDRTYRFRVTCRRHWKSA